MALRISEEKQAELVQIWERLRLRAAYAKKAYRQTAEDARKYYDGPHDFVFENLKGGEPTFKVTVNKVYEMLRLFGPMTYAQNPARNVEPKPAGDPKVAAALTAYLNYTPGEFGLKEQSRQAIDEALLNGRGVIYTGMDRRTGLVRSVARNSKDILIDPDAATWYSGKYMMWLERDIPLWEIARGFGRSTARKIAEGGGSKAYVMNASYDWGGPIDEDASSEDQQKQLSLDKGHEGVPAASLVHVFSKMGIGMRAKRGDSFEFMGADDSEDNLHIIYEPMSKTIMYVGAWPIPFWADSDKSSWPFSFCDPAENFDKTWPISLIKPAMGEQMFLDWGWSFAMGFIRASCRVIMVSPQGVDSKLQVALESNAGISIAEIDIPAGMTAKDVLQALEQPRLSSELLALLQAAEELFEKRTGMNEILYGVNQKAMRSATEASMKGQYSRMRIDDINDKVEDWQTQVSRKEAVGARWLLQGQQLLPIVGPELAQAWDISRMRQQDIRAIMGEYSHTVVAGSIRKRTPQARIDTASMMMQSMAPLRLQVGDLAGYNMIEQEWLRANAIPNAERFLISTPPVPEQQAGAEGKPGEPPQGPEIQKIVGGEPFFGNPTGEAS